MTLRVGIAGCTGRMGQMLVKTLCSQNSASLAMVSATPELVNNAQKLLEQYDCAQASVARNTFEFAQHCDAIIDFTTPDYTLELAQQCEKHNTILVCGTTGFSPQQEAKLLAHTITLIKSSNFSIGVNLLMALTRKVAATLDESYDIEITETHHRYKKDAPSGTALSLGEAAAQGRQVTLTDIAEHGRSGLTGERKAGTIGFHALRAGDVIGDHTVLFATLGERIELTHKASDRRIYADGALRAALWAKDKPHGCYSMQDVLRL